MFPQRSRQATDLLEELAGANASVFLMGHGLLNLQIAKEPASRLARPEVARKPTLERYHLQPGGGASG